MERRVLVTGAGSGLGLATVLHLAEIGFTAIGLVPNAVEKKALLEAAHERGLDVEVLEADLADADGRTDLLAGMKLWALVNNAGYMNAGQLRDVPIHDARDQLEVMVLAPLDLTLQALGPMIAAGQGRIVNVTTSAVHTSTPLTGWYQACKAALRELNDALRVELLDTGVNVIDLEPGGYRTGIWARAEAELNDRRSGSDRPELYDRVLRRIGSAEPAMGEPDQVAQEVGKLLTSGQPPRHRRIGPGSGLLRFFDQAVPDRVWDRLVATTARTGR
jgi:NAD(P)-dependent dehydrogenase (short-subunit alcohol dehydrogenase family)